jgi:hypothetical protein
MKKLYFVIFLFALCSRAFSQGCSDAGFCSIGSLKNVSEDEHKHNLDIGFNLGYGVQKTVTYNPYLQYSAQLNNRFTVQGKLTATYASGFLGDKFNIGDIYGIVTYNAKKSETDEINLTGGIKIPLTTANDKNASGLALPLDYQSSLGTYDFIAGINYIFRKHLELDAGLQLPVIQNNHNSFFLDESSDPRLQRFANTNSLHRQPDVLFRLGYYINLPRSFSLKPNLLAIYRLGTDSYITRQGISSELIGTGGLTLNEGVTLTNCQQENR